MKEGAEEKNVMDVVGCKGFKKFLNMKDCNKEKCEFHLGIQEEPVYQRGEDRKKTQIGVNRFVRCGFPRLLTIQSVCELAEE